MEPLAYYGNSTNGKIAPLAVLPLLAPRGVRSRMIHVLIFLQISYFQPEISRLIGKGSVVNLMPRHRSQCAGAVQAFAYS